MRFKNCVKVRRGAVMHWVGDGFPVMTLFSYDEDGAAISPFLLLDYVAPTDFAPSAQARGVGQHPHRGFETVTIIYAGEVEHKDNAGHAGRIGAGDVQWMTAARGILHEEMHGRDFTRAGGRMQMVQLWVNLPAQHKMDPPRYQEISRARIPVVSLPNDAGSLRVIAGDYGGVSGAAATFTPVNVWDAQLKAGSAVALPVPDGFTAAVLVLKGAARINNAEDLREGEVALFATAGEQIAVAAEDDTALLILSGAPIDEPVVGRGPFVMNSQAEISQAMEDYRAGRF